MTTESKEMFQGEGWYKPPPWPSDEEIRAERIKATGRLLALKLPARALETTCSSKWDGDSPAYKLAAEHRGMCLVVISGTTGCGKTCAAARLVIESIVEQPGAWGSESRNFNEPTVRAEHNSVRWATAAELTRMSKFDDKAMAAVIGASFLVIDDLGAEYVDQKGAWLAFLDEVVNERYSRSRPTVITTNLNAETFKERYGDRIADRIREAGAFIATSAQSRRRREK